MGDFNYPGINWETLEADSMSQGFLDLTRDCFLIQHVPVPTRNNNILDLVMTTEANMVENIQVIEHFCNSDHNIIVWDLVLTTHIMDKMHKKQCFYKANYVEMRDCLSKINWDEVLQNKDVKNMWTAFMAVLNNAIDISVPLTSSSGRNKKNDVVRPKVSKSR